MQPELPIVIKNSADLVAVFSDLGTEVGPRYKRTKDQKEWYCLRCYMLALGVRGILNYPIEIGKAEPPDFILADPVRGRYGVEVTEATEEDWQRELARTERDYTAECMENSRSAFLTSDDGWVGDSPEKLWRISVLRAIGRKIKSISRPDYPVGCCDLLILEQSRSGIVVDRAKAIQLLRVAVPYIAQLTKITNRLGRITVLSGQLVLYDLLGAFQVIDSDSA